MIQSLDYSTFLPKEGQKELQIAIRSGRQTSIGKRLERRQVPSLTILKE